jgi:chorismate synthase
MRLTQREEEIFWAMCVKPALDFQETDCWIWHGPTRPDKGPVLPIHQQYCAPVQYKHQQSNSPLWASAREVSWQLAHGVVHMDQKLVSTCGNDLCINPAHMILVPLV